MVVAVAVAAAASAVAEIAGNRNSNPGGNSPARFHFKPNFSVRRADLAPVKSTERASIRFVKEKSEADRKGEDRPASMGNPDAECFADSEG